MKTEYDLSKLTQEHIQELDKDPNIHDIFVKIEVVKNELEVGKWYKFPSGTLGFYQGTNVVSYGVHSSCTWCKEHAWFFNYNIEDSIVEATPEEVTKRLAEYAKLIGIKEGATINISNLIDVSLDDFKLEKGEYYLRGNELMYKYKGNDFQIMSAGQWCEVIVKEPAYIQVPISEIDGLSSKKLGRFVKELASKY